MFSPIKHVYVHVPFCLEICSYCDFKRVYYHKKDVEKYLIQLDQEIYHFTKNNFAPETIYIGGGTPSSLSENETKDLLMTIAPLIKGWAIKEYTIEANPRDINEDKLLLWKKFNIDRISLGVQTFNDHLLKSLERDHSVADVIKACKLIKKHQFELSIDLIYNLPQQTKNHIETDLQYVTKIEPDHISWYSLIIKEGSKLKNHQIDLQVEEEFMSIVIEGLKKLNYHHYEIANFTKKRESLHNKGYWMSNNWIGFGYGAVSFIDGFLIENKGSQIKWFPHKEKLAPKDLYEQVLMMGLRHHKGLDLTNKLHYQTYLFYKAKIDKEITLKTLKKENQRLFLTKKHFMLLDSILLNIVV